MYNLEAIYFNESFDNWIRLVHASIFHQYDMELIHIEPNDFGFDSYASILNEILPNITPTDIMDSMRGKLDTSKYIEPCHSAWSQNYIRWKGIYKGKRGKDPTKYLNTSDRNERATTHVSHLEDTDIRVYQDVINIVFDVLGKKILEAGMQQLSI